MGRGVKKKKASRNVEPTPSETQECISLKKWLDTTGLRFIHIPNGMYRTDISGALLEMMGVQAGFPDYMIFDAPPGTSYRGLVFEMKKRAGGVARDNQREWLTYMASIGWLGAILEGSQQAVSFIAKTYGITVSPFIPTSEVETFHARNDDQGRAGSGADRQHGVGVHVRQPDHEEAQHPGPVQGGRGAGGSPGDDEGAEQVRLLDREAVDVCVLVDPDLRQPVDQDAVGSVLGDGRGVRGRRGRGRSR